MSELSKTETRLCVTGVEGLDEILQGGLPANRFYLVAGDPGVGKTTLGLQFLLQGAAEGESTLYITLSETKDELEAVAESHGWALDKISLFELSAVEQQLISGEGNSFFHPSEMELAAVSNIITREVERVKPKRVVFDSLSELRLLSETPIRHRRQILNLKQFFAKRGCTVLLMDDLSGSSRDPHVESIAHGVVRLERTHPSYGATRRRMMVEKMRGHQFKDGYHDFSIQTGGLIFYPRLVAAEHHRDFASATLSTGLKDLDSALGGGLDEGTSTVITGPPGCGKSTLALKVVCSAVESGLKASVFVFDETLGALRRRMKGLNLPFLDYVAAGKVHLQQIDPAEMSPGEMAHLIHEQVEKGGTRLLVLDTLNGYMNAMPEEEYLTLQMHELLSSLAQNGVTTLMVLTQKGIIGHMTNNVDISYLADSMILLRYFESNGEVKQALSVVKKRSGNHERTIREYKVTTGGLLIGEPLREFEGVLTGTPRFKGKASAIFREGT